MRKAKGIAILFLGVCLAAALFGCADPAQPGQAGGGSEGTDSAQSSPPEQAVFPVTLADAAGREVTIEREPQRLVSGDYITTSMLVALGQGEKVAGIGAEADTRPIYRLAAPEFLDLPNVGTAKAFDLEGCAALTPDLVILPLELKDSAAALEELEIAALTVNPEDLASLEETIALLGTATGAEAAAEDLLTSYLGAQAFLARTLKGTDQTRVYLAGSSGYLSTAGAKMHQNTLIELGGGENVAAGLEDNDWSQVSYEQLLAWDPQVILIASDANYTREDLLSDPQLAGVDAIEAGRVYAMPSSVEAWDSPVPGALMGSLWTASILHPELYSAQQFQEAVSAFYGEFYHIELDSSLLTR